MEKSQNARCVHCRSDVAVPDAYAHGDHIKCGTCGTQHKIVRGEVLRLVIADVAPLRDALRTNEQRIDALEDQLRAARASFGIGANGIGIGVIYALYQVAFKEEGWTASLLWEAIGIALVVGIGLEVLNYLFFAKRQTITQLNEDIEVLRDESRQLQQKIREATRL